MAYGIGSTVENANVRVHRSYTAIRVTELTGAGKRGKRCREYAVYDLDRSGVGPGPLNQLDDAAAKADTDPASTFDSIVAGLKAVETFLLAHGCDTPPVYETVHRGVDVPTAATRKWELHGKHVDVRIDHDGFCISDLDDRNNLPTLIQRKRAATSTTKLRTFAQSAEGKTFLETETFHKVWTKLQDLGIDTHYYCAMD